MHLRVPRGFVSGNSGWYLIQTVESFNSRRSTFQGNFIDWCSSDAFGSIDMIPIMEKPEYTLYGGDVSAWSGLSTELPITAISDPEFGLRNMLFDTIDFSSQPIPEPSTWCLLGLGTLLLGWRMRRVTRD